MRLDGLTVSKFESFLEGRAMVSWELYEAASQQNFKKGARAATLDLLLSEIDGRLCPCTLVFVHYLSTYERVYI